MQNNKNIEFLKQLKMVKLPLFYIYREKNKNIKIQLNLH